MRTLLSLLLVIFLLACENNIAEVNALADDSVLNIEIAHEVVILYSDSADVKVRITAPKMIRHVDKANPRDEFPDGIHVEFLNQNGNVSSWLDADRAIRDDKSDEVIAQGKVNFYNKKRETLSSTELIWDENSQKLHTNKFVRIAQPEKGDTSFGFGFETNEEFTQFEIKRKTSSVFNIDKFKESISD